MVNYEGSWRVSFDHALTSIYCSYKIFEAFVILCSCTLRVSETNDVKAILDKYILRRWRREVCCSVVQDFRGKEVKRDPPRGQPHT